MKCLSSIITISIMCASANLYAENYCGELKSSIGTFDYNQRFDNEETLRLVEGAHFTSNVENLIKGNSGSLGAELAYTLAVFPNHHRALMSIGKLALREKNLHPYGARYSVECYFERAIRFKPDDGIVLMVYGIYLSQSGNLKKAIEQIEKAEVLQPENPNINYNLGLLYFKNKNYEKSLIYAKKAYRHGFPLPGLKNMLNEEGKWNESAE